MLKTKRLFENGNVAIKKCRHGLFAYNINDTFIGRSLDLYGEWTEPEFIALEPIIEPGDIIIDVGAYIGTHTVFFAQKASPGGLVFAIEPQRFSFNLLSANVALNNLINVVCLNKLASNNRKKIKVPVLDPSAEQNFGALKISQFREGNPTETLIIDDLKLGRCKLIKIDVEEGENKILAGAKATIEKCQPVLYVENNTLERSAIIIKKISSLGYRCFWHIFNYYNPKNYFRNKKNVFSGLRPEANMLCFPKEVQLNLQGFVEVEGVDDNWQKALQKMLT
jgi:FkbM family methyltransferase